MSTSKGQIIIYSLLEWLNCILLNRKINQSRIPVLVFESDYNLLIIELYPEILKESKNE